MLKNFRSLALLVFAFACASLGLNAQTALTQTTLASAVTTTKQQVLKVASVSGISAPSLTTGTSYQLFIDDEVMDVEQVNGTLLTVRRGADGTKARTHASGANVYVAMAGSGAFIDYSLAGSCSNGTAPFLYTPVVDYYDAQTYQCENGQVALVTVAGQQHFPSNLFVTSSYTNATTTYSAVSNLSFPVSANHQYTMSCTVVYQGSATTAGPKFEVTGPSSPSNVLLTIDGNADGSYSAGIATAFSTGITTFGTLAATSTNYMAHLYLTVLNGANAGTVQLMAAANGSGTLTIQPGSGCIQN